jgi:guanylate kinase
MFVLSSPSGAGKTTLSRRLMQADGRLHLSVSVTTRPPRPSEQHGVDYHFVDVPRFEAMRSAGELLEWAHVFGNLYGTPRAAVMAELARGNDVLFDIDWQGTQQLRSSARSDLVSVFILPPSAAALEARLVARAQDSSDVVRDRMARAGEEMSHWAEYDYVILNNDLDESLAALQCILAAERLRRDRQTGLTEFVADLRRQSAPSG